MKNNSKINTVLLMIAVILLGSILIVLVGKRTVVRTTQDKNVSVLSNENTNKNGVVKKEEVKANPDYPTTVTNDKTKIIDKIVSNYTPLIKQGWSYQVRGCMSSVKSGSFNYEYYVVQNKSMADGSIDVYDMNGTKTNSCPTYSSGGVDLKCKSIISTMDSCTVVYGTSASQ